ncbi:MAG: ABC transporter permease [Myxococcota bacterium]
MALFIGRKDVAYALRARITVLWLFIMPIVFMFFIGTTTKRVATVGGPVGLAIERGDDGGYLSDHLIRLLEQRGFDVAVGPDAPVSQRLRVPARFTSRVLSGDGVTLEHEHQLGELSATYDALRIRRAAYTLLADVVTSGAGDRGDGAAALAALDAKPRPLKLKVMTAGRRVEIPSGFEQAVPGMMVMFTMLVLLTSGAIDLFLDRKRGVLRRLAAAPVTRGWIVAGKWAGKMSLALTQIGFAMLVGTLLFGMRWGPDLFTVVAVLAGWAALCASLALLLGSVGRTEGQVMGLGLATTMLLGALGGCWWPIEITPSAMQTIQKMLPSGWTMDALHRLISFQTGPVSVLPHLFSLALGALLLGWLAQRHFRFE